MIQENDIKKLCDSIEEVTPLLVQEWNNVKIKQFHALYEKSFSEYYNNRQTQEKTKNVSPVIDTVFTRLMSEKLEGFEVDEGKGRDYKWNDIPIECKITLSDGNSWTGNGYSKTDIHVLFRFNINDDGIINSYLALITDLSKCESGWSAPAKTANFSQLKFLNSDITNINVLHGSVNEKSKYLSFDMVKC